MGAMIERYRDPQIASLFSDSEVYSRWAKVELAVLACTYPSNGPGKELLWPSRPTPPEVAERERQTHHEMVAFLQVWQDNAEEIGVPGLECGAIHRGLTSSDVQDTALMMALVEANARVGRLVDDLEIAIYMTMKSLSDTDARQIGRTHGQWAIERPASWLWQPIAESMDRRGSDLRVLAEKMAVGKLSGPVGIGGGLSYLTQIKVLRALGLGPISSSQIIPRDDLATWASQLANLVTVCEHAATQVRLLSQSEIGEVREGHHPDTQVGSSAMPHKSNNPITAENICGLARMARGYASMLQQGIVQWGDRDLAHSSVERVAIPDLLHVTCTALERTKQLVSGLVWSHEKLASGLAKAKKYGGVTSYRNLIAASGDKPYLQAHEDLRGS